MELKKVLEKYIENKNANYAVLVDGDWGSGKTFYIKNNIVNRRNNVLYISLYGISNTDQLSRSICNKILISKTYNNPVFRFFKRLWDSSVFYKMIFYPFYIILLILNYLQTFIIWLISLATRNIFKIKFGVDIPLVKEQDYNSILSLLKHLDNYTFVIDDLERCSLPFDVIFGYLNNLVEHKMSKCIIISNEVEVDRLNKENFELKVISVLNSSLDFSEPSIFKNSNEKSNNILEKLNYKDIENRIKKIYGDFDKYKLIKEKLVGKTYHFTPDIADVYEKIVFNYNEEPYKLISCLVEDDVVNLLNSYKYYNIRTLQFYADVYNDLSTIMSYIGINESDIKLISDSLLKTCIFYKKGYPLTYPYNDQKLIQLDINNNLNNIFQTSSFYALDFVIEYILRGCIEKSNIKETLNNYKELITDREDDDELLLKLESYWFYDSDELKGLFKDLIKNIKAGNYNGRKISKILSMLSYLDVIKFDADTINKTISEIKKYISSNKSVVVTNDVYITNPEVQTKFNEYFDQINNLQKSVKKSDYISNIEDDVNHDEWGIEIYDYISNYKRIYYVDGFVSYINIDVLQDKFLNGTIKNIYYFKYSLDYFYQHCDVNLLQKIESEKLLNIKDCILNILLNITDPMRINPLNMIVESIEEILTRFKN